MASVDSSVNASASHEGTQWVNEVPDSEVYTEAAGWDYVQLTALGAETTIGGIPSVGLIGAANAGTKGIQALTGNEAIDANHLFGSAYVAKGDADHCYISMRVTNASFAPQGGVQYFNLVTGAEGSFVATGAGAHVDSGIEEVDGGYYIWAIVTAGGNDDRGGSFVVSGSDVDGLGTLTGDASSINIYIGGLSFIDAPTGDVGYIPT